MTNSGGKELSAEQEAALSDIAQQFKRGKIGAGELADQAIDALSVPEHEYVELTDAKDKCKVCGEVFSAQTQPEPPQGELEPVESVWEAGFNALPPEAAFEMLVDEIVPSKGGVLQYPAGLNQREFYYWLCENVSIKAANLWLENEWEQFIAEIKAND